MQPLAWFASALLVALSLPTAARAAASPEDQVIFFLVPDAPTPADNVALHVRRYDQIRGGPLITTIRLCPARAGQCVDRAAALSADYVVGPAYDVYLLGKLPPGQYFAAYYEVANPTYLDEDDSALLVFDVTESGPVTVVEYFNLSLGHYFITADASEIAKLDGGTIRGWSRTGESFRALSADSMPSNATPVCRFYGLPEAGLDSHFLSDDPDECAEVARRWPDRWILETDRAFGVGNWRWSDYFCEYDYHAPLYRLYNNRPDANHRYTTSPATRDAMRAQGWLLEARWSADSPDAFSTCVLR
jgi:hypothetical protein